MARQLENEKRMLKQHEMGPSEIGRTSVLGDNLSNRGPASRMVAFRLSYNNENHSLATADNVSSLRGCSPEKGLLVAITRKATGSCPFQHHLPGN
jgi:hypothetical protein